MRRLDEELRARAEAWLEDGLSPSTIARKVGCSTRTIQRLQRQLFDEAASPAEDERGQVLTGEIDRGDDDESGAIRSHRAKRTRGAGSSSGWIAALAFVVCGIGGVVLVRRRLASLSIGSAASSSDMALVPLLAGAGVASMARTTTPRAPRAATVAPYPGDDAIFGHDRVQEAADPNPRFGLLAYENFAVFPTMYDFVPESDVDL